MPALRKLYTGCYRMTLDAETFGQVKGAGRHWTAEVRRTDTGTIVRHAGIWPTRRSAVAELVEPRCAEAAPRVLGNFAPRDRSDFRKNPCGEVGRVDISLDDARAIFQPKGE